MGGFEALAGAPYALACCAVSSEHHAAFSEEVSSEHQAASCEEAFSEHQAAFWEEASSEHQAAFCEEAFRVMLQAAGMPSFIYRRYLTDVGAQEKNSR